MIKIDAAHNQIISDALLEKDIIMELVSGFGSPLNLIFPQSIVENKDKFLSVFEELGISGKVYYAHKANRSLSLVRSLALQNNSFIDVASINELISAFSAGFTTSRIEATGPKNYEFIHLGVQHGIVFNVDNFQELETLCQVHGELSKSDPIKILIRLTGFSSNHTKIVEQDNRFGTNINDAQDVFDFIKRVLLPLWISRYKR